MVTGTMTTAIRKVHAPNGPWITSGGWEYNAVLIAAVTALAENGPGSPSVDAKAFPRLHGTVWALTALAAGVAGSYLAERPPLNEPEPASEPTGRFERVEEPAETPERQWCAWWCWCTTACPLPRASSQRFAG